MSGKAGFADKNSSHSIMIMIHGIIIGRNVDRTFLEKLLLLVHRDRMLFRLVADLRVEVDQLLLQA